MIEKLLKIAIHRQNKQPPEATVIQAQGSAHDMVRGMDSDAARLSAIEALARAKVWCAFWAQAPALARWVLFGIAVLVSQWV